MNNLKRELAPLSSAAWKEIDAEASRVLKLKLAAASSWTSTVPSAPPRPR